MKIITDNLKRVSICSLAFVGLSCGANAQVLKPELKPGIEDGIAQGPVIMQDIDGYKFVWNEGKTHFVYQLKGEGKEVKFLEKVRFFYIGETMIQLKVIQFKQVKVKLEEGKQLKDLPEIEILKKHATWESDWVKEMIKQPELAVVKKAVKLNEKKEALFWYIEMPAKIKKDANVEELDEKVGPEDIPFAQCYLTMVDHENIVLMNTFIMKKEDALDAEKFLLNQMNRIQFSDKPVNFTVEQKKIVEAAKALKK